MSHTDVLFRDLHADDLPEITEVESMCFNCHENGTTKLLLTKIPFFREVIVASFKCEDCGFKNATIDSAGRCQSKGVKFTMHVLNITDMNRRVVLNKGSILCIPELDSSFPIIEGALTTLEGALAKIMENINDLQEQRREQTPEVAAQLDEFLGKLKDLIEVKKDFFIELTDASGNSVIENLLSPKADPQLLEKHYKRSSEENEALGFEDEEDEENYYQQSRTYTDEAQDEFKPLDEVMIIAVNCSNCNVPTECRMKVLNIPNFKEVIVMASSCEVCGIRENEIVAGCGIAEKGQRITVKIDESIDLSRDFLKAESAGLRIPELDIETQPGSLGGRFTTIEGILRNMADKLNETNPFTSGDSAVDMSSKSIMENLVTQIRSIADGKRFGVSLIINDPAGNSYVQDICYPEIDSRLTVESYDRTDEENEDLGLDCMKTENYQE